jgi:glycosyltransferase involved in cell wall biosynthesis
VSERRRAYLDIQTVQSRGFFERGIPRYTTQLCLELIKRGAPVAAFGLNPNERFPRHLPTELARAPQLLWNTAGALREAQLQGPILYHVLSVFERPSLRSSALPDHVLGTGIPIVCTVYDLIPDMAGLLVPGSRDERFHRIRNRVLAEADLLLALSEKTRADTIEHLGVDPDRVVVVGAAATDFFRPPADGERPAELLAQELPKVKRPFLLTVSAWAPHKNTELAIEAFAALPHDLRASLQLVVACTLPVEGLVQWEARAADVGLAPDEVVFTGFVADPVLRALYQTTQLCVYPSRYEGFGLPVLEAARCGSPAITSNCPPLPEVLGWAPTSFDPDDAGALAALIERSLTDREFRARLQEVAAAAVQRHTWDRVTQRTLRAYERVDAPTPYRRARRRLRTALVGPFPPARSGVADYNARLTNRLVDQCDLDCFVDAYDWTHEGFRDEIFVDRREEVGRRRPSGSRARWFPTRALGRSVDPARYDAVIYTIGSSWFHHETLAVARRYPGVVWFHDIDLVGLYITYAHRLLATEPAAAVELFREVLARYGSRAPDLSVTLNDLRWATHEPYHRSGLRLAAELACDSLTNIVSSQPARNLLEFDAGPLAPLAPIEVIPLAPPQWASRSVRSETYPPVVVTMGRQDNAKLPEQVIDAIAIVNQRQPVRLAIVGEIWPDHRARLQQRVEVLRLGAVVDITGFVTDREYSDWIHRAVCAVQLRAPSKGEGSAAVADALAAGLPVITNIPSCIELPDGTVDHINAEAPVETIAAKIQLLLDDPAHRARLRDGALRYVQSWSVDDVASRLLQIADRNMSRAADPPTKTVSA